jgi:hypothetical protein
MTRHNWEGTYVASKCTKCGREENYDAEKFNYIDACTDRLLAYYSELLKMEDCPISDQVEIVNRYDILDFED